MAVSKKVKASPAKKAVVAKKAPVAKKDLVAKKVVVAKKAPVAKKVIKAPPAAAKSIDKPAAPKSTVSPGKSLRLQVKIQTAEGWKRGFMKQHVKKAKA